MKLEGEAEKRMHRNSQATVMTLDPTLSSWGNHLNFQSSGETRILICSTYNF